MQHGLACAAVYHKNKNYANAIRPRKRTSFDAELLTDPYCRSTGCRHCPFTTRFGHSVVYECKDKKNRLSRSVPMAARGGGRRNSPPQNRIYINPVRTRNTVRPGIIEITGHFQPTDRPFPEYNATYVSSRWYRGATTRRTTAVVAHLRGPHKRLPGNRYESRVRRFRVRTATVGKSVATAHAHDPALSAECSFSSVYFARRPARTEVSASCVNSRRLRRKTCFPNDAIFNRSNPIVRIHRRKDFGRSLHTNRFQTVIVSRSDRRISVRLESQTPVSFKSGSLPLRRNPFLIKLVFLPKSVGFPLRYPRWVALNVWTCLAGSLPEKVWEYNRNWNRMCDSYCIRFFN